MHDARDTEPCGWSYSSWQLKLCNFNMEVFLAPGLFVFSKVLYPGCILSLKTGLYITVGYLSLLSKLLTEASNAMFTCIYAGCLQGCGKNELYLEPMTKTHYKVCNETPLEHITVIGILKNQSQVTSPM